MLVILVRDIYFQYHSITDSYFLDLLAALVAPLQEKGQFLFSQNIIHIKKRLDHLRTTCDLMNFYFAFDEYTDVADKAEASQIANDVMDSFRRREARVHSPHGKITTMAQE